MNHDRHVAVGGLREKRENPTLEGVGVAQVEIADGSMKDVRATKRASVLVEKIHVVGGELFLRKQATDTLDALAPNELDPVAN